MLSSQILVELQIFYLFFDNNNDTERAFAREYATNTYSGTTQTEITSKDYYPDNVKPLKYYDDQNKGIDNSSLNLDALDGNGKPVYRVLEAGKYYDIIERDNASNYRVFTIYVTGKDSSEEKTFADDSNLSETEFATTNLFVSLNLLETTFENGQEVTTSAKNYFGLNSEDEAKVQNTKTLNNLRYATSTFQDIATNASYSKTTTSSTNSEEEGEETQPTLTASIMNNDSLYWLILRYKLTTNTGIQQRTILYFPSADINSGRETSNHIPDLKTMLALGNNAAVEFVTSKQDLLDTLNSLIIDAKNQTQNNTGAKFELEFLNKLNGNPYYAVTNELKADNSIATVNIDGVEKAKLITKDLTISAKFDLNINIAELRETQNR